MRISCLRAITHGLHLFGCATNPLRGAGPIFALVALPVLASFGSAQSLLEVEGTVELQAAAAEPWLPASGGDVLEVGGALRTFQGEARLDLGDGGVLRLGVDSELSRGPRMYLLASGRVFVQAEGTIFDLGGPLRVAGEVRLDNDPEAGQRVAVISGSARATVGARVLNLEPGQQLLMAAGEDPEVIAFSEDDPWYRDLVPVAEGRGEVLGFRGTAELMAPSDAWQPAEIGAGFTPGMVARTGADSWLEVQFEGDNLIRLQANSMAELRTLATYEDGVRRTVLALLQGTIWAVVGEGENFEIQTPGLVAGVRGTTFRLDSAGDEAPPLLKVFEGEVAAEVAGETITVPAGSQFDPITGTAALELDELDTFNLERDRLTSLTITELTLAALPLQVVGASLELVGQVTPANATITARVAGSVRETVADGSFQLTVPLTPGFNLLEVRAEAEGATTVTRAVPLIRLDSEPFLALATERLQDRLNVRGVTDPGALLRLALEGGTGISLRADSRGRFSTALPLPNGEPGDLTITVTDTRGNILQRRVPASAF